MTSVLLIYPYFNSPGDRSTFRFPPLGLAYLAAGLIKEHHEVKILDCTFLDKSEALDRAADYRADIVGIYSMASMKGNSLEFARMLRNKCSLLLAGGPLPTTDPQSFINDFDIVVIGEGEHTLLDIVKAFEDHRQYGEIPGIVYRSANGLTFTVPRQMEPDLNSITFPARELIPNDLYIAHWKKKTALATTTIMTTRGCPFNCEFCSNAVFGISYRERSAENVVDEVEQALSLGYGKIHFADDVFTLRRERVHQICEEIKRRSLHFKWECLGRVDSIDLELARNMREAGCERIFFGIESADDSILRLMREKITLERALKALEAAGAAGIKTGAFFILCYPGETNDTVLHTVRVATSLPLDYLSFTLPYPLRGTALYERVKGKINKEWNTKRSLLSDHSLIYDADFSENKMKFAILKGQVQFWMKKRFKKNAGLTLKPFEMVTDLAFKVMK